MHQLTTFRWSLDEEVSEYRAAGFDGIGLWRQKLDACGLERAIEALDESGLSVSSLSWAGGFTGAQGISLADALDDAREAIAAAAALKAPTLVVVGGGRGGHTVRHSQRLVVKALQELGDFAGERGVRLALQPMLPCPHFRRWTYLNTIDSTLDLLAACRHRAVRLAFDVYQLWHEPNLIERIPAIADYVAHVQLSDCPRVPAAEYEGCLPGDGIIPVGGVVQAFLDGGYEGWFDIQVWSEQVWASDYTRALESCRDYFHVALLA